MALKKVREICMALPSVEERLSHGEPTWFYRGKRSFAMFADHHHDERLAVWVAATPTAQEALIQSESERYFRPPYVGVRGWVGIYLDVDVDWPAVEDIVAEGYRLVSAKG